MITSRTLTDLRRSVLDVLDPVDRQDRHRRAHKQLSRDRPDASRRRFVRAAPSDDEQRGSTLSDDSSDLARGITHRDFDRVTTDDGVRTCQVHQPSSRARRETSGARSLL